MHIVILFTVGINKETWNHSASSRKIRVRSVECVCVCVYYVTTLIFKHFHLDEPPTLTSCKVL